MILFLKIAVFTVLVPGTVAAYVPYWLVRDIQLVFTAWVYPAGLCFLVGTAIYLWCAFDFGMAGGGTPAPVDPPRQLVVRGLYRYVRNPMYVGVLTVLLGWNMLYRVDTLLKYTIVVFVAFNVIVLFYEEPRLRRRFGEAYSDYRAKVGRWVPGFKSRTRP